ncbi:alkaline phosphatase [Sphingomonas jatrophae]|uniref:Alkaline phosphatase n=1 Tax=Sphingomonas jatrophae TaxID=1166337 RepID=A0A1I6J9S5_9SPHN|nr:alkaline phosphatase [Sphingomonas jatrophae]SFR75678.1 alkaline phosphatase [Sphingomonas jatrophae]
MTPPVRPTVSLRTCARRAITALLGTVALFAANPAEAQKARNVILFLGDAGGLPTLNAAGILAHDRPQSLFIHTMPHMALSDTSSLNRWVTDSGAGMTAIMTGQKTNNAMVSVVPTADGSGTDPVKTVLEYAEQRGLSTGVITNKAIWDATPAATYAHVAARSGRDDIFHQLLAPRFGDGVDILVGKGRKDAETSFAKLGQSPAAAFARAGYLYGDDPTALSADVRRSAILRDQDFLPTPTVEAAISSLRRNRKGYFLMVEWDMHTDDPEAGLRHAVEMDDMIRRVSAIAGKDTLILFVADHSFGLRLRGGLRATPLSQQYAAAQKPAAGPHPLIDIDDTHTGEEVVAVASGPGSEKLHGFVPNTQLFDVMMQAYGWTPDR